MTIPRIAIAAYRAKPGKTELLLAEVHDHHPLLLSEGLVTGRAPIVMQAKDGTVIEVFEWASPAAIGQAHANPLVQQMWGRFVACSDYVPLSDLEEAKALFAEFEPLDIHLRPVPTPDAEHREE